MVNSVHHFIYLLNFLIRMENICIVHEPEVTDMVEIFVEKLRRNGDEVMVRCGNRFPIGDNMFVFLEALSWKFDKTFVIISGKPDSILSTWISRELKIQRPIGNFTNVYPAFLTSDDIQLWWVGDEKLVILSCE
jgi:hypothetical protein